MKYIRTKDGRIYEFGKIGLVGKEMEKTFFERPSNSIFESEIVKQADTIEELCDYVFLFDEELTIRKITHEDDKDLIEWLKQLDMEIKLAILTDKGLIYVAKMNEEGELELL